MGTFQKVAMGVIGLAVVATLVATKNQAPAVINSFGKLSTGVLSTAMGNGG